MMLDRPLRKVDALAFRYPVSTPVRTSFGVMHDRPAVFVRVEDADAACGWGEVWCNFRPSGPSIGRASSTSSSRPLSSGSRTQRRATPSTA